MYNYCKKNQVAVYFNKKGKWDEIKNICLLVTWVFVQSWQIELNE